MRFLRFSIRRLLLLTGIVAVVIYVLFIRPVTVAKDFVYTLEHAAPAEITKYLDYVNSDTDGAYVEGVLNERTWTDVFTCRQTFVIAVVCPTAIPTEELLDKHDCISTPFGVNQQEKNVYVELREKR